MVPDWLPLPYKRAKRRAIDVLRENVDVLVRERRAATAGAGGERADLLSIVLAAVDAEGDGKGMSDVQARDELITLINAGHDTTGATLAWALALLARNPEW